MRSGRFNACARAAGGGPCLVGSHTEPVAENLVCRVQQNVRMRVDVGPKTDRMAPPLWAVGLPRHCKRQWLALFRTGSRLVRWRQHAAGRRGCHAKQHTCRLQTPDFKMKHILSSLPYAHNMQRQQHAQLFMPWPDSIRSFTASNSGCGVRIRMRQVG